MATYYTSPDQSCLYDAGGQRKYVNDSERARFLLASAQVAPAQRAFAQTLFHTGCRLSEARALTPGNLQLAEQIITFRTLKRRCVHFREVPIPLELAQLLHPLSDGLAPDQPLWRHRGEMIDRATGFRWIKALMNEADVTGVQACPRGLRHGFAVHALGSGMPLNLVQKWMGHADIRTTALYAAACGLAERRIAQRMWEGQEGWSDHAWAVTEPLFR